MENHRESDDGHLGNEKVDTSPSLYLFDSLRFCLRLKECVQQMNVLLDLRHHSNRPLHQDELRELIILSAIETLRSIRDKDANLPTLIENSETKERVVDLEAVLPGVAKDVEGLIFRITNTLKSESAIWESASMYHTILIDGDDPAEAIAREIDNTEGGQGEESRNTIPTRTFGPYELALQARSRVLLFELRLKQLRSVVQIPQWEKELKQVSTFPLMKYFSLSHVLARFLKWFVSLNVSWQHVAAIW
jgi:hypothetical protein